MSFAAPPWGDHIYADDDEVMLVWLGGTGYASLPALRDNIFSLLHSTGVFRFLILFLLR